MSDWEDAARRAEALRDIAIEHNVAIIDTNDPQRILAVNTPDSKRALYQDDDALKKVMEKRARIQNAERIQSLVHELSEHVRSFRTNAGELELKRWVEAGDVAIHSLSGRGVGVVVAMPMEKRVVADIPGTLSPDDARWLGLRLIEAATLAEGVAVVRVEHHD